MHQSSDCVFCKIAQKKNTAKIIFEDELFISFLDHRPISKGHTLVIPKNHYVNMLDITESEIGKYLSFTRYVAKNLFEQLNATGFNLYQNNYESAGQVIFHIHFHILPRFDTDKISYKRFFYRYEETEIQDILSNVRRSMIQQPYKKNRLP